MNEPVKATDLTGRERRTREGIRLYAPEDFQGMRAAGRLAAECLDMIGPHVEAGTRTDEIDHLIHQFVIDNGATSATIGYRGYKHASCISVNEVVCHGIPGPKKLRDGDILNIDVTLIVDGWHGDTSRMYTVGKIKPFASRLIQVTYDALMKGIDQVRPGNTFGDIGHAIQSHAEAKRCSVVRDFCGHGLGRVFHDLPNVVHFGRPGEGAVLQPGMFFTIEPMVNLGTHRTRTKPDGWTAVTQDGKLSAQFEHAIGVTEDGCEIFTLSPGDLYVPVL
ncbi:MAG: type I methionyl aminopeptidase [Pseudomonadota bacterium]